MTKDMTDPANWDLPEIYVDYQNLDDGGYPILDRQGTVNDLRRLGLELKRGLLIRIYQDDGDWLGKPCRLTTEAHVFWNDKHNCWSALMDWNTLRHEYK